MNMPVHAKDYNDPYMITAMCTWRMTQGVYRFDPTLMAEILKTPIEDDLPARYLMYLPEWCIYLELDSLHLQAQEMPVNGAWVWLDCNLDRGGMAELRILLEVENNKIPFNLGAFLVMHPVYLGAHSIAESWALWVTELKRLGGHPLYPTLPTEVRNLLVPILSLTLYLCANPDIQPSKPRPDGRMKPGNPGFVLTRQQEWELMNGKCMTEWVVGARIGAALRAADAKIRAEDEKTTYVARPRAHIRRGHWHTIVSGPRLDAEKEIIPPEERRRELRWMPPIPVNVEDYETLPATIRSIKNSETNHSEIVHKNNYKQ